MEHFTDASKNDEFRTWMEENPSGFYLNHRSRASMMLHRVGCPHLGSGEKLNLSKNPKFASTDEGELEVWLRSRGQFMERCSTCGP